MTIRDLVKVMAPNTYITLTMKDKVYFDFMIAIGTEDCLYDRVLDYKVDNIYPRENVIVIELKEND